MPADPGIILMCVGTPIGDDGRSDLSQLDSALAAIQDRFGPDDILVIRSTLPVGGTRRAVEATGLPTARVFTNPEFLRQGTAVEDFGRPTRIVIGRFDDADPIALEAVMGIYDTIEAPRLVVDVEAAEIIKNGANAFLALKLSFTNEIASLCEEAGADVDEVLAGIGADPRIGRTYMQPSFGFGGSCLPKELIDAGRRGADLRPADARHDRRVGRQPGRPGPLRRARRGDHRRGRRVGPSRSSAWPSRPARTTPAIHRPSGWPSGCSPGARRSVRYDPAAGPQAAARVPDLDVVDDPARAVIGADVVVVATEWREFRDLPWAAWVHAGAPRLIIDGRRLLDAPALRAAGYRVIQLGDGRPEPDPEPAGLPALAGSDS